MVFEIAVLIPMTAIVIAASAAAITGDRVETVDIIDVNFFVINVACSTPTLKLLRAIMPGPRFAINLANRLTPPVKTPVNKPNCVVIAPKSVFRILSAPVPRLITSLTRSEFTTELERASHADLNLWHVASRLCI